jgi:hypothetical protein
MQSATAVHGGKQIPWSAMSVSILQLGRVDNVQSVWSEHSPSHSPVSLQLGQVAVQSVLSVHGPKHRWLAGSQFGLAGSTQSALVWHGPKQIPFWVLQFGKDGSMQSGSVWHGGKQMPVTVLQFGFVESVQSALVWHAPMQRPVCVSQLGNSGGQSLFSSQGPKHNPV